MCLQIFYQVGSSWTDITAPSLLFHCNRRNNFVYVNGNFYADRYYACSFCWDSKNNTAHLSAWTRAGAGNKKSTAYSASTSIIAPLKKGVTLSTLIHLHIHTSIHILLLKKMTLICAFSMRALFYYSVIIND